MTFIKSVLTRCIIHNSLVLVLVAVFSILTIDSALIYTVQASPLSVSSKVRGRSRDFLVPVALRPRVDFWKDIYATHGKYQVVIHHRNFPQVIFKVLDLSNQAAQLSPVLFDKYKKREVERHISEINQALKSLKGGASPQSPLEELVHTAMQGIPGGVSKYKEALDDELVRSQTGIKEKMLEAIERSGRYLPIIESIFVKDFNLPIELTRLPFVESSFDYTAYSSAGAAGIWQFMPRTAKSYMMVGSVVDERRDPVKSSAAAARYLADAHRRLGSWPLAITSYNHGVGGVLKRVREMGTSDMASLIEHPTKRAFGFASGNFFPCFLAALEVYDQYQLYFPEARLEPPLKLVEYRVPRSMSVGYAAKQIGIDVDTLKRANYALLDRVWSGRSNIPAGYALKVPIEYSERLANLRVPEPQVASAPPSASSSIYGGITYKVRSGDTLSEIAKKYGVLISQIEELNDLRSKTIRVGQVLTIKPREAERRESPKKSSEPTEATRSKGSVVSYTVRPGDTLHSIARAYNLSIEELQRDNALPSSRIRVGQTLTIHTNSVPQDTGSGDSLAKKVKVGSGDSLWTISKRYGVSVEALKRRNNLKSSNIRAGQTLILP